MLLWFALPLAGMPSGPLDWSAGRLLTVDADVDSGVELSLRIDGLRAGLLLCGGLLLFCGTSRLRDDDPIVAMAALPVLASIAVLATDLVVVLAAWLLLESVLEAAVIRVPTTMRLRIPGGRIGSISDRSLLSLLRLSSGLLLLALLMIWSRYQTLGFDELLVSLAGDDRIDTPGVVSGLSIVFAGAVSVRLGLFPAIIWAKPAGASERSSLSIVLPLAALIPATALATQVLPLSIFSADGGLLLSGLGGFTLIAAPAFAASQPTPARMVVLLQVAVGAQAAVTLGTGRIESVSLTLWCLVSQLPLLAVCGRAAEASPNSPRFSKMLLLSALVLLLSGTCHQNAVLALLSAESLDSEGLQTLGLARDQVFQSVWWASVAGHWLTGLALARCLCRLPTTGPAVERRDWLPVVVASVAVSAPFLIGTSLDAEAGRVTTHFSGMSPFGAATPAGLLGAVIGWLLFREDSLAARRIFAASDSFIRLSREWCYLDRAAEWLVRLPVRLVSAFCEFIDCTVLGRGDEAVWQHTPAALGQLVDHLRRSDPVYLGVGAVLFVAGLLLALTQAGG